MTRFKQSGILVVMAVSMLLWGCGLKKMIKKYPEVKYEVVPEVLETHGGKINVQVKGTIPAKYFHKKAVVDFTPVLKYNGGEYALKSMELKGEKAEGDGTVIGKKTGGSFAYTDVVPYKPEYNSSELVVNAKATLKKDVFLGVRKLADGVIYTSQRVMADGNIHQEADKYVKEVVLTKKASIYFPYNAANLNWTMPLNKDTTTAQAMTSLIEFTLNDWTKRSITMDAWASPEGEESLNNKLSEDRAKAADSYFKGEVKKLFDKKQREIKGKEKYDETKYPFQKANAKGEDWDGFMKSLNASTIKDKKAIENVVRNQQSVTERQQAIRDMTVVYKEVEENILPPLRRAEIVITALEPRKTDEQIATFSTTTPDSLTVEELLYAATLTQDKNTKIKVYKNAMKVYPKEIRGYLNAGYYLIETGNYDDAQNVLEQGNAVAANNGKILNNLGVVAVYKKDYPTAKTYFENAQNAGTNTSYNMGVIFIKEGDYTAALNSFAGTTCKYNLGLVHLLVKDYPASETALGCAQDNAETFYLRAVLGARTNNLAMLTENLKKAIDADGKYRAQAKEDREFLKFFDNSQFQNAIK